MRVMIHFKNGRGETLLEIDEFHDIKGFVFFQRIRDNKKETFAYNLNEIESFYVNEE